MIRYKDTILEEYFIDPVTAIITNSKGEIQEVKIRDGRPVFKSMEIHRIQVHTHLGYKKGFDIHHIDKNKMNNALSNLVYLSRSAHIKIHANGRTLSEETKLKIGEASKGRTSPMKGKHRSEETKRKIGEAMKGENNPLFGKHHSEETKLKIGEASKGRILSEETKLKIGEALKGRKYSDETKRKMSESNKGKNTWTKNLIWINNGVMSKMLKCDEEIPTGFVRGRLKRKNN